MSKPLRVMVAATEYPGHAFPEFALAAALRVRGHEVLLQTSDRWREAVAALDVEVVAVEDVDGVPHHGTFGPELVSAVRGLSPVIESFAPDVVVSDLATAAPPLAAELAGVRTATVVATMFPVEQPGLPLYPLGFVAPRTGLGAALWRGVERPLRPLRPRARRLRAVAEQLDEVRAELGLGPHGRGSGAFTSYGMLSAELTMVATFPQLEYPRRWPPGVQVSGPMIFDPPAPPVEPPLGEAPLVIVAGSTAQDPELRLVKVALAALADEPVRVVATTGGRAGQLPATAVPDNAAVVDWLSFDALLPRASLVITRGGHGTVVRALAGDVPLLVCPVAGDMPENGARVAWAGAGLMLPRYLLGAGALRTAVRRLLAEPRFAARARELGAWSRDNDGAGRGAELVERHAGEGGWRSA
jgi:UDP:flavonoid glycosyltransferase YjiC (YdhE family)